MDAGYDQRFKAFMQINIPLTVLRQRFQSLGEIYGYKLSKTTFGHIYAIQDSLKDDPPFITDDTVAALTAEFGVHTPAV